MLRRRTVLELCDPDPFTVATWILMSLTTRCCSCCPEASCSDTSVVAIPILPLWIRANLESLGVRVEMKWNPSLYGRSSSWFRCQGYCLNSYAVELRPAVRHLTACRRKGECFRFAARIPGRWLAENQSTRKINAKGESINSRLLFLSLARGT